jgi:ankyrin repeat protein
MPATSIENGMPTRGFVLLLTLALAPSRAATQTPQTRLWDAAIFGDTVALAAALKDGAKVDSLDVRRSQNGRLALNWAAINNRMDALRFLLAHGASIEATNLTGYTALHHAAEYGSLEAARVLLAAGADPKHTNLDGVTPAARALQEGHTAVADLLLAAERGERPKDP